MALKFAILTLLLDGKKTGYELSQDFDSTSGYYWSASHQQIYKTLPTLLEDKLVSCKVSNGETNSDKKTYAITRQGKKALKSWVELPTKKTPTKNTLLIKMLSTSLVGKDVIITQLQAYLKRLDAYSVSLKRKEEELFKDKIDKDSSLHDKGSYLTLRKAMLSTTVERVWVIESLNLLK